MKLTFLGTTGTVTGSRYPLRCGAGMMPVAPAQLPALLLTHGEPDAVGAPCYGAEVELV